VEYPGYGGGRGLALDCLLYAAAGYAHFFMDVRGQGSGWRAGDTPDREPHPNPHHPGFMTRGGLDPRTYYYRRVITDAVRAVDAARQHPLVDPSRVAATGHSQGGGLTLAVAGLVSDLAAALPEVPFLCDIRRGTEVASEGPALFSAALMDTLCPASTVYGAYHHYTGPKRIEVYPYNGHEEVSRSIKRCRCGSWPRSSVRRDLGLASRPCTPVRRDLGPEGLVDL
jgi:cephalosporin-C deacetylase